MRIRRVLAIAALVSIQFGQTATAVGPEFLGLGGLHDRRFLSSARGVSGDGSVVFGRTNSGISGGGTLIGYTWTREGGMVPFELISSIDIVGVNHDGTRFIGRQYDGVISTGVYWAPSGAIIPLHSEGSAERYFSSAQGMNDSGSVIVGEYALEDDDVPNRHGPFEAFRWTEQGGFVGLGLLEEGGSSEALAVSNDGGVIVGQASVGLNSDVAFRWTEETGMVSLGDLRGDEDHLNSNATDVSADGSVVVGHSVSLFGSSTITEAFYWSEELGMVGLGNLYGGGNFDSAARAISADGAVVVGDVETLEGREAFVWDEYYGMRSIQDLLIAQGVDLTGWTLEFATGVSADGRVIVGNGEHNGSTEAWVVVIPAPGTCVMLGCVGVMAIRRRR